MSWADDLRQRIGCEVSDEQLELAVTHRSYAYENGGVPTNERLEFLGDAVLGVVVTEKLFAMFPELQEGGLARLRSAVVNANALADIARTVGLGEFLRLGRGEESTGGRDKSSILADLTEAIIGAVYIDCGLHVATGLIHGWTDPLITSAATMGAGLDWKTSLQELTSAKGLGAPIYVIEESGPDHAKHFVARVLLGETLYGYGEGRSKRVAEQAAAAATFQELVDQATPDA